MKARITYTCGCERTVKLDKRVARNRSDVKEAELNNGVVARKYKCLDCEEEETVEYVRTLDRAAIINIISECVENHEHIKFVLQKHKRLNTAKVTMNMSIAVNIASA